MSHCAAMCHDAQEVTKRRGMDTITASTVVRRWKPQALKRHEKVACTLQSTSSIAAHSVGLAAMDAKADLVVTAGYGGRQGRVVLEPHVKVISPTAVEAASATTL